MPDALESCASPRPLHSRPWCTIGVLTWGDHLPLVRRCLESLDTTLPEGSCERIVAANDPSQTVLDWLRDKTANGSIDRLLVSRRNLHKCPMIRHLLGIARGQYLWWFDDDSHVVDPAAFDRWAGQVERSSPRIVGWGATAYARDCGGFQDAASRQRWIQEADWFCGLPPPGTPGGPEVWWFLTGSCWWMRTAALRAIGWPDPRLLHVAEDILLGEAVRQQGWHLANIANPGIAFSDAERRGHANAGLPRAQ